MADDRAYHNQRKILEIRRGQQLMGDHLLCEVGLKSIVDAANVCEVALGRGIISEETPDFERAREAVALGRRVKKIREHILNDQTMGPFIHVIDNGYLTVERNILLLQWGHGVDLSHLSNVALSNRNHIVSSRRRIRVIRSRVDRLRAEMVDDNMGLIQSAAWDVCRRAKGLVDDMISIALGQFLICMDETYDPGQSALFSTYAARCMRLQCVEAMGAPTSSVRIPKYLWEQTRDVVAGRLSLDADDVSDNDKRDAEARIRRGLANLCQVISLDAPLVPDGNDSVLDHTRLPDTDEVNHLIDEIAIAEVIRKAVAGMSPSHQLVARHRMGGADVESGHTLLELSRIMSKLGLTDGEVTRQRVGQIWDAIRDRMMEYMSEEGII